MISCTGVYNGSSKTRYTTEPFGACSRINTSVTSTSTSVRLLPPVLLQLYTCYHPIEADNSLSGLAAHDLSGCLLQDEEERTHAWEEYINPEIIKPSTTAGYSKLPAESKVKDIIKGAVVSEDVREHGFCLMQSSYIHCYTFDCNKLECHRLPDIGNLVKHLVLTSCVSPHCHRRKRRHRGCCMKM